MDILPIGLLIAVLFGIKIIRPLANINKDYLSIDTSKCYRGLFAIVVVFHHLALQTQTGIAFRYFASIGHLAVAYFFFLSGYGLQKSYMIKGDVYRKDFLAKRLPVIIIPYIIVTTLYWITYAIGGNFYSFKDVILAIVNGWPIVSYSWYIINIFVFYIAFYFFMCICRKHYFYMLICACAWYFLYVLFCVKMEYGSWWYISTQVLIVGMFWAIYENKILNILRRNIFIIPSIWILFIALFIFQCKISSFNNGINLILYFVITIVFSLSIVLFSMKFQIGNVILNFLGDISLEIYLIQGLFIAGLRNSTIYISNDLLYAILVVAFSIILGYILHFIFNAIISKYRNILK